MTTKTYPFTTPGNYTYDSDDIMVDSGEASLALQDNTGQTFIEDFADDTGFTYNNSYGTISGTYSQDDQRPSNAVLHANFETDEDANWGDGTLTGTKEANTTVSGGYLNCDISTGNACFWDEDNLTNTDQTGAIRFVFQPSYSGTPPASRGLFTVFKTSSNNNKFNLYHNSSGFITIQGYDSTGTIQINNVLAAWNPTSGQDYEFELNYDLTAGATRVFIDGTRIGATLSNTYTRSDTDLNAFLIGNISTTEYANGKFAYVTYYNAVQHTSNYTAPLAVPYEYIYRSDVVTLPAFSYSGAGSVQAFTGFSVTDAGSPRYIVNNNYWNGSAWVSSDDSYSQANSESDVNTNIGSLTAADTVTVKMVTQDSNTQNTADDVQITYTGQTYATDDPFLTTGTFETNSLSNFVATETESGSDAIKYIINVEGQDKYVTGGSVANSNGTYAQSSTEAEILSDIENFVSARSTVYLKVFFHSDDGTTSPSVDIITITHDGALDDPTTTTRVQVEGFIYDCGSPIASQEVKVRPFESGYFNEGIFHKYAYTTIGTTDSNGYFQGYVYLQGSTKFWDFKIGSQSYKVELLDQEEMDLADAPTFEVITE